MPCGAFSSQILVKSALTCVMRGGFSPAPRSWRVRSKKLHFAVLLSVCYFNIYKQNLTCHTGLGKQQGAVSVHRCRFDAFPVRILSQPQLFHNVWMSGLQTAAGNDAVCFCRLLHKCWNASPFPTSNNVAVPSIVELKWTVYLLRCLSRLRTTLRCPQSMRS